MTEGPFASIADFVERADTRKVNKKVLESLVKAGAFDSLGITRAAAMESVTYYPERSRQQKYRTAEHLRRGECLSRNAR